MEGIDIKGYIAEAAEVLGDLSEYRTHGFFEYDEPVPEITPQMIKRRLMETVWSRCVMQLNQLFPEADPLAAERAIAELKRQGGVVNKSDDKETRFNLRMQNGAYRLYKHIAVNGFSARPWPAVRQYSIDFSGRRFAEFVLEFDSAIPEIDARVPAILEVVRAKELEKARLRLEFQIKEKVVRSLIDQFLKPLGLTVDFTLEDGDMVSVVLTQVRRAEMTIPFSELPDKFRNTAAIMDSLQTEPPRTPSELDADLPFLGIKRR